MLTPDYKRYISQLKTREYLPKAIVSFIEHTISLEAPIIKKKLKYEYDALQHQGGKSILSREQLYPYANLNKAEERLKLILGIKFSKSISKDEFALNIQAINEKILQNKNFAKEILSAFLREDESFYQNQAETSSSFAFMCYFLAYFTFLPFFMHTQSQIKQNYQEEPWAHGHCPYCGAPPLMSYLKGKEGKRVNSCSTCLGFYRVPRIQCPYCLENKQSKFSIFTADTDPEFQICICKSCKTYIKINDYKEYEKFNPHPLLDDFKSITLDIIAENNKYSKAVLSLWLI